MELNIIHLTPRNTIDVIIVFIYIDLSAILPESTIQRYAARFHSNFYFTITLPGQ